MCCGFGDSLYVPDVLYDRDGGKRPETIVTDTASYNDIVFGLLVLAGFAYAPQLADLPDQKMWRIDRTADHSAFQRAACGRVDLARIARHWEDILRIIGSTRTGTVRAYDMIRMLSRDGRPTPLGDAIAHYGRISKSLRILRLADEPGYRHQIKVQANLQEGRHALARKIFHGRAGQLHQRYQDGTEDQIGALGRVLDALVLFNPRYMGAAVAQLRADGFDARDEDAARLSPFVRYHVDMLGRYSFHLTVLRLPRARRVRIVGAKAAHMFGGWVRIADHATWDRGFPVKYLLVREDEDGVEQLWGRCAGVEGLFADPVPPPREVLTLRGCLPDGLLSEVLAEPDASPRGLGDVCVEVWDDEKPVQWWTLVDAVVVTHQPHSADPARYDIVLGAGVRNEEGFFELPAAPRFELFAGTAAAAARAGQCSSVDGLFEARVEPAPAPLELIGCEPAEPLLAALRRPRRRERDRASLLVLDRQGAVMASRSVGLAITGARPSVLGGTLVDITLTDGGDDRPPPAARPVWAEWYQSPPGEPNLWAPYDSQGRAAWLDLTTRAWRVPAPQPDRSGGEHHLDGRFVTDVAGLHCAIAEALLGPGRYFGREWNAFKDCLGGGFGVAPPFTLTWHDSEIARRALRDVVEDPEGGLSYFEDIVRLLERCGVTVVLR